jgi:hypothetical protein
MKFEITTLVDVTETRARFDINSSEWQQQQNYITMLNTIGIRANLSVSKSPSIHEAGIGGMGFGKRYKGIQKYWTFVFEIEYGETSEEIMTEDFHLVPVIIQLDETAKLNSSVFNTIDAADCNILFKQIN